VTTGTPPATLPELDRGTTARPRQLHPWKVVVLDCNGHSFEDVELALMAYIPGMTRQRAYEHANEIHFTGASVVHRCPKEQAEHIHDRLAGRGLRVTIEADA
jgi:ATP-dependent Clp protease adaptor protein ClpS